MGYGARRSRAALAPTDAKGDAARGRSNGGTRQAATRLPRRSGEDRRLAPRATHQSRAVRGSDVPALGVVARGRHRQARRMRRLSGDGSIDSGQADLRGREARREQGRSDRSLAHGRARRRVPPRDRRDRVPTSGAGVPDGRADARDGPPGVREVVRPPHRRSARRLSKTCVSDPCAATSSRRRRASLRRDSRGAKK